MGNQAAGDGCLFTFLAIALLVVIAYAIGRSAARKRQRAAWTTYQGYLGSLKADPTNPDLKQATLQAGRVYSNLTRNRKGITLFDEVSLMNDIGAATARANQSISQPSNSKTLEERLATLGRLKESGVISQQEFENRRVEILRET